MSKIYSPKIVTDSLVMCLDASNNKSYPTDLPVKNGLVMWMDAADDTTFSYSSGTTVSQWRDKSGFNYHMGPKVNGPTRSVVLNSRKVLAFTAAQTIGNNTMNLASSANTVFVVSRLTGVTNGRVLTCNLDASGNNWLLGHHGGTYNDYFAEGWVSDGGALDANWRMYMGDWSGTSTDLANLYSNGTAITTNSTAASQGPKYLGVNYYSNEVSTCEVAEIIVFDRVLSTAERRLVHTYLGQKWGISNTDRSIVDLSNNNNHGLFGGAAGSQVVADMPLFDVYNKGAIKFDGSSDYLTVADYFVLNPTTVTVSMWLKRNDYQSSICNFLRRNDRDAYALMATNNTDTVWFRIRNSLAAVVDATTTMPLNTWTNLVGTFDGSNVRIYKNGILADTKANTSPISYSGSTLGDLIIARDDIVTGRYAPINVGSTLIYSRALSAAEVLQNYEALKSKFANTIVQQGLVLNLDAGNPYSYAGAGTTWYDVSGNSYNGTLTSSPVYSTDSGGAFTFAGNYSLSPASTVNSLNGDALTVEAWVKHDSFGVAGTGRGYVSNWNSFNTLNQRGFILRTYDTQTNPSFWWCWGGGNNYDAFGPSSYVMQTGRIYHIVATYEKNVAVKIYINGNLEGTGTNSVSNTIAFDTGSGVYVGFSDINNSYMYGNIYSTRLYNRVLSAAQVLQNYNATKGRFGL